MFCWKMDFAESKIVHESVCKQMFFTDGVDEKVFL